MIQRVTYHPHPSFTGCDCRNGETNSTGDQIIGCHESYCSKNKIAPVVETKPDVSEAIAVCEAEIAQLVAKGADVDRHHPEYQTEFWYSQRRTFGKPTHTIHQLLAEKLALLEILKNL